MEKDGGKEKKKYDHVVVARRNGENP